VRWISCGSPLMSRKASAGSTSAIEKGAAGDCLTIGAVAGIDELRCLGDLVADGAASATAGLRELHRTALLSSGGLTAAVSTPYSNCRIGCNSCENEIPCRSLPHLVGAPPQ
jgi:hypothetical protein